MLKTTDFDSVGSIALEWDLHLSWIWLLLKSYFISIIRLLSFVLPINKGHFRVSLLLGFGYLDFYVLCCPIYLFWFSLVTLIFLYKYICWHSVCVRQNPIMFQLLLNINCRELPRKLLMNCL